MQVERDGAFIIYIIFDLVDFVDLVDLVDLVCAGTSHSMTGIFTQP